MLFALKERKDWLITSQSFCGKKLNNSRILCAFFRTFNRLLASFLNIRTEIRYFFNFYLIIA